MFSFKFKCSQSERDAESARNEWIESRGEFCFSIFIPLQFTIFLMDPKRNNYIISTFYSLIS